MLTTDAIPLEDELGDVLEKAMRRAGITTEELSLRSGVSETRILEAIDYHPGLRGDDLCRLASALDLNEVGLCALASGRYPLPEIGELPFELWPLRMPHGIGVVNAYVVAERGAAHGLLFDSGAAFAGLEANWPGGIRQLDAVFLTHVEAEHVGGLCAVVERFDAGAAFVPAGARAPCGCAASEGDEKTFGPLAVRVFSTPGHAAAHNCYLVTCRDTLGRPALLISGDLVFAGSVGGGFFSHRELQIHLQRMLAAVPPETIVAPGHGPLTTAENELRFNPFVS
jgi:hydroxyacylglutathione hydrolase